MCIYIHRHPHSESDCIVKSPTLLIEVFMINPFNWNNAIRPIKCTTQKSDTSRLVSKQSVKICIC